MDGVTSQKLVFFVGATNRPDILDPALMRPGRLDSLIYIGLPDFEARVSIFQASLRKSPVDPEVNFDYLADRTDGFSGADIAAICKSAAKHAIRTAIDTERKKWLAREAKKKECAEKEIDYESDDDEEEEAVPYITRDMLLSALSVARRSVTTADLEKYMKYKRDMERKMGMDEMKAAATINEANASSRSSAPAPTASSQVAPAPTSSAAPRDFGGFGDDSDDDDIYDD